MNRTGRRAELRMRTPVRLTSGIGILALSGFLAACVSVETPDPAGPLLQALHLPPEHWHRKAVRFDIEAGKETWILNAYETPAPDGNGLCTSQGKSWTVIRDAASGAATVKDQSDERLVYLGPDTGAQACADIPVARYTWVAAGVDLPSVRPLLQALSATAACAPSDRPGCGHWSKVDLPEDVVEQFSALPRTRVDSIYHRPDGRLSVVYGPFRNYAGMLDCVISFNADGSRNLDVLPPSL